MYFGPLEYFQVHIHLIFGILEYQSMSRAKSVCS